MRAQIIDGKQAALALNEETAKRSAHFLELYGRKPGLAAILTGDDPASAVYVRNKSIAAEKAGLESRTVRLPATCDDATLLAAVEELNQDPTIDGIIVQLPLPNGLNAVRAIDAVAAHKDADGFHTINAGKLFKGRTDGAIPCTPLGCMKMIRSCNDTLRGKHAVILGRSEIVGKPMASLLLAADCTVTIVHSGTKNPEELAASADILIAAVGKPGLVRGSWVKEGATIIDVGINRIQNAEGNSKLVGDVCFEEAAERAAWITPVPGGVGPMTVACLMHNTVSAAFSAKAQQEKASSAA